MQSCEEENQTEIMTERVILDRRCLYWTDWTLSTLSIWTRSVCHRADVKQTGRCLFNRMYRMFTVKQVWTQSDYFFVKQVLNWKKTKVNTWERRWRSTGSTKSAVLHWSTLSTHVYVQYKGVCVCVSVTPTFSWLFVRSVQHDWLKQWKHHTFTLNFTPTSAKLSCDFSVFDVKQRLSGES